LEPEGGFGCGEHPRFQWVPEQLKSLAERASQLSSWVSSLLSVDLGMSYGGSCAPREKYSAAWGGGLRGTVREAGASRRGVGTMSGNQVVPLGTGGLPCRMGG